DALAVVDDADREHAVAEPGLLAADGRDGCRMGQLRVVDLLEQPVARRFVEEAVLQLDEVDLRPLAVGLELGVALRVLADVVDEPDPGRRGEGVLEVLLDPLAVVAAVGAVDEALGLLLGPAAPRERERGGGSTGTRQECTPAQVPPHRQASLPLILCRHSSTAGRAVATAFPALPRNMGTRPCFQIRSRRWSKFRLHRCRACFETRCFAPLLSMR